MPKPARGIGRNRNGQRYNKSTGRWFAGDKLDSRFSSFGRAETPKGGLFTAKFGPFSKLRKALYNLKIHRAKVSNTPWMELPDPIILNSEYQRYFVFNDETSTWNISAFDPNVIQGTVT